MPRISSSGSFAGVYSVGLSAAAENEAANYVGAVMTFAQTSAPTGWTKITTYHDAILKVGLTNVTTGGVNDFSSTFNLKTLSGSATVDGGGNAFTMSAPHLAPHTHTPITVYPGSFSVRAGPTIAAQASSVAYNDSDTQETYVQGMRLDGGSTGGVSHSHPAGTAGSPVTYVTKDMAINYVDIILASKD